MKISVADISGHDVEKAKLAMRCIVLLDGKEVALCVEANEEEGYVICYDETPAHIPKDYEGWPTYRKKGVVKILDPNIKQQRALLPEGYELPNPYKDDFKL